MSASVLYLTNFSSGSFDPADLFDLAFLLSSPEHRLLGVGFSEDEGEGERVWKELTQRTKPTACSDFFYTPSRLQDALECAEEPVSVVVVGGYKPVAELLASHQAFFRKKVARLFLIGGHINSYAERGFLAERAPIDPRLRERNPERFRPEGDARVPKEEKQAFAALLTSGESVIWLPRDVCLWRYAAPSLLEDGGEVCEWLLRELLEANLPRFPDREAAADAPALMSALPALLLAANPDPTLWLRLFRAVTAHVETDEAGNITSFTTQTDKPNLYTVVGIDGAALGKLLTARLRVRPLRPERS